LDRVLSDLTITKTATARPALASSPRELLVAGSVPFTGGLDHFEAQVRAIESFKKGPDVLAARVIRYGNPADFAEAPLPDAEFNELRSCRPGNCSWRMPTAWMNRLQREVRWRESGASSQAWSILREELSRMLRAYRRNGASALPRYDDKTNPLDAAVEVHELALASSAVLPRELVDYLVSFPRRELAGAQDIFYWSVDRIGRRPVFSMTHMTIYRTPDQCFVTARQLYGSHYMDGSLGITRVDRIPSASSKEQLRLTYINRSRLDLLEGAFSRLRRMLLEDAVRKAMQRYLGEIASRLQRTAASEAEVARRSLLSP